MTSVIRKGGKTKQSNDIPAYFTEDGAGLAGLAGPGGVIPLPTTVPVLEGTSNTVGVL